MGIYSIIVLTISIFSIAVGFLSGIIRGSRRAILRLILVVLTLVAMLFLNNYLVNTLKNMDLGGQSLSDYIMGIFPEEFGKYEHIIMPLILTLLSVVTFIVGFFLLQWITLVLYWILKLFVKPKKKDNGVVAKNSFVGMFIGLIQGLLVALVFGAMLTGLANNVVKLSSVEINEQKLIDLDEMDENGSFKIGISDYCDSTVGKIYSKAGGFIFNKATTIKIEDEKYTFDGQIEALTKAIEVAYELSKISTIDFTNGLNDAAKKDIVEILNNLDNITADMTEEVANTLNNLVQTVAGDMVEMDLSDLDLSEVKFSKVASAIELVDDVQANPSDANISALVNDLIDSNVVFVIAETSELTLDEFDSNTKELISSSISERQDLTAEERATLNDLFGIN